VSELPGPSRWFLQRILLPCAVAFLLFPSCGQPPVPPSGKAEAGGAASSLLIGLPPEQNIFKQMERYEPIAAYLAKKAGVRMRFTVLPRYGNVIGNFVSAGMDGAFFGSFTYAVARKRLGVEALARPVDLRGGSTYHGLIFVRKDSGIRSVEEMRGKRFAMVDRATTAGYLLPLEYFEKHGKDYRTYLGEYYFAGTHEAAIRDVLDRKADVGAAKNTVFERLAAGDERLRTDLTILERSRDVPENALAVRKDLDIALKGRIKDALLAMHLDAEGREVLGAFGAQRFIETNDEDYRAVYDLARSVGLDLATFDDTKDR
jgi:phosphonate transport system substrate-binding protein